MAKECVHIISIYTQLMEMGIYSILYIAGWSPYPVIYSYFSSCYKLKTHCCDAAISSLYAGGNEKSKLMMKS